MFLSYYKNVNIEIVDYKILKVIIETCLLTDEEKVEQAKLRQEYIANVRGNLRSQLNNMSIQEADGTITNLGEKFGNKGPKS